MLLRASCLNLKSVSRENSYEKMYFLLIEESGKSRNSPCRKELIMHSFLLRQLGGSTISSSQLMWYMKMFFTLTCKERGEGLCTDFLWVKSTIFWWKDWKILSVLLNHSSSVIKVGVFAPHTLEPALCKQFNKNCGYDRSDWHFGVLFCPSYNC